MRNSCILHACTVCCMCTTHDRIVIRWYIVVYFEYFWCLQNVCVCGKKYVFFFIRNLDKLKPMRNMNKNTFVKFQSFCRMFSMWMNSFLLCSSNNRDFELFTNRLIWKYIQSLIFVISILDVLIRHILAPLDEVQLKRHCNQLYSQCSHESYSQVSTCTVSSPAILGWRVGIRHLSELPRNWTT